MPSICHNAIRVFGDEKTISSIKNIAKESFLKSFLPAPQNPDESWYLENWGTREFGGFEWIGDVMMFDTSWSPPYDALLKISKSHPEIVFKLDYIIAEMLRCGYVSIKDGQEYDMIYYSVGRTEMTNEEVAYGEKVFREILNH